MNLDKYKNPILALSGGKDSLACLYYLKHIGETNFRIVWSNTGKAFDTLKTTINQVRQD